MNDSVHFIDFSVDPDTGKTLKEKLPAIDNTVWYNMIGNVAYIGFSGAYDFADTLPYFEDACAWVEREQPVLTFVVGHWNEGNVCLPRPKNARWMMF